MSSPYTSCNKIKLKNKNKKIKKAWLTLETSFSTHGIAKDCWNYYNKNKNRTKPHHGPKIKKKNTRSQWFNPKNPKSNFAIRSILFDLKLYSKPEIT